MSANDNDLAAAIEAEQDCEVRRFERHLPHPPERVWEALTEPDQLAVWFPPDLTDPVVKECSPPHVLEMAFEGETLRWELTAAPDGCVLVLETTTTATTTVMKTRSDAVRMAA